MLAAFVISMQGAGADEARAIGLLTEGALGVQFWLLVVAVGLGCPLIAAITQLVASRQKDKIGPAVPVGGAACALVGGFTLRFVVLAAGLHAALVSPAALQAVQGALMLVS